MTSEWQDHNAAVSGSSPRVQYAYSFLPTWSNNESRPTSMTYSNGTVIGYTYTAGLDATISRLSSMTVSGTTVEGYNYLGLGTVVKRTHIGPGVDLTYVKLAAEAVGDAGDQYTGLDRFGRVVSQRWIKTSTSTNVDQYGYTYDRDSNRTAKTNGTNAAFNETYGYDNLNQLTSFAKTGTTKTWDYDAVGNWDGVTTNAVTESRTQNKQNEILTATGQTAPTYDPNGNATKDFGGKTFVYDAWNRLLQVNPSGGGAALRTYELDATGRRIEEVTGGVTTDLYYTAGWQLAEERVAGTTRRINVWSPVYVDALILRDRDADSNGSLEERLWAMQDANYNITGLLNSAGTVQERYAYDPYGTASIFDNAWVTRASSSFGWVYLHQGLRFDATTNKYYVRNREYDPQQGRWLTMDPLGFAAGDVNLYGYEGEGPTIGSDALGLEDCVAGCHGQRKQSFAGSSSYNPDFYGGRKKPTTLQSILAPLPRPDFRYSTLYFEAMGSPIPPALTYEERIRKAEQDRQPSMTADHRTDEEREEDARRMRWNDSAFERNMGLAAIVPIAAPFVAAGGIWAVGRAAVARFLTLDEFCKLSVNGFINPYRLRYSQDSIGQRFKEGGEISKMAEGLKDGSMSPSSIRPIRIVEKDGKIYTLDNRRLWAHQDANVPIKYMKLDKIPTKALDHFSTYNGGRSIEVREK